MPVSPPAIARWMLVIFLLIVITIGVTWLVSVVPPSLNRFFGGSMVAAGAINVLLRRRFGRQTFDSTRSMPGFIAKFWERIGNEGAQSLYLGIGMVLTLAGFFLLIKSARS